MKLGDVLIIMCMIGLVGIVFSLIINDTDSQNAYGTDIFTNFSEEYGVTLTQLDNSSTRAISVGEDIQGDLQVEDEIGLITIGGATVKAVKASLNAENLNIFQNLIQKLGTDLNIPPGILTILTGLIVLIVLFLVVGAILRWRT